MRGATPTTRLAEIVEEPARSAGDPAKSAKVLVKHMRSREPCTAEVHPSAERVSSEKERREEVVEDTCERAGSVETVTKEAGLSKTSTYAIVGKGELLAPKPSASTRRGAPKSKRSSA